VKFWVDNALAFGAFTVAFSALISATYWSSFFTPLLFLLLFAEFFIEVFFSHFLLGRVVEFSAPNIILITALVGWPLASLFFSFVTLVSPRPSYYYPAPDVYTLLSSAFFSLFHCLAFSAGALLGAGITPSLAERLRRRLLFAIMRSGGVVNVLKLAISLGEDPLNVREAILHLLKDGYIEGRMDETMNELHVGLSPPSTPTLSPSATHQAEILAEEYNIVKSFLRDLEELRERGEVSDPFYERLREEYERRLRRLESLMSGAVA